MTDGILALLVGLLVGGVMGSLGGGGGIIAVPALVYLLGQEPLEATTTSLVVVGVTAVFGAVQYARAGEVNGTDGVAFSLLGVAGAVVGARLSLHVDGDLLMTLFAVLLVTVAWLMWHRGSGRPMEGSAYRWLRLRPFHLDLPRAGVVLLAATGVGLLTGFFGVGGGFAIVPALTLILRLPLRRAVGTSLLVLAITSLVGLLTRISGPVHLDVDVVVAFTASAVIASLLAGRFSARLAPAQLSRGFAVFLVAVAIYTAAHSVPGLVS